MAMIAAIGMFDGVHCGHRYLLDFMREIARHCDPPCRPMVVTFRNHPLETVRPELAPALLTDPEEKRRLLEEAGMEVAMLDFDENLRRLSAAQFLAKLRDEYDVTKLVLGFNNRFGSDKGLGFEDYRCIGNECGVEVVRAPEFPDEKVSSSFIRQLFSEGRVEEAQRLLGRPYRLEGKVVNGNKIGRTIGFPTVNLDISDSRKLIPAVGVYVAKAKISENSESSENSEHSEPSGKSEKSEYLAVVNIGHRPTVDNSPTLRIEAFLDGFHGDLYGQTVELIFIERIRDERRFDSVELLREQIASDLAEARKICPKIQNLVEN